MLSPAVTLYFCGLESRGDSVSGAVRPRYTSPSEPTSSITPGWEGGDGMGWLPHRAAFSSPKPASPLQLLLAKLRHRSSPRRSASLSQPRCPLSVSPPSPSLPCWGLEGAAPWAAWGRCWCVCPRSTSGIGGSSPRVCGTGQRDAQRPGTLCFNLLCQGGLRGVLPSSSCCRRPLPTQPCRIHPSPTAPRAAHGRDRSWCPLQGTPGGRSRAVPAPGLYFGNSFHRRHHVPTKLGLDMRLQGLTGQHGGLKNASDLGQAQLTLCSSSLTLAPSTPPREELSWLGQGSLRPRGQGWVPMSLPVLMWVGFLGSTGQAPGEAGGWRWRGWDHLRVSGEGDRGHGWVTGARRATLTRQGTASTHLPPSLPDAGATHGPGNCTSWSQGEYSEEGTFRSILKQGEKGWAGSWGTQP